MIQQFNNSQLVWLTDRACAIVHITNTKDAICLQIFSNIKTLPPLFLENNKAQVVVQNQLLLIIVF